MKKFQEKKEKRKIQVKERKEKKDQICEVLSEEKSKCAIFHILACRKSESLCEVLVFHLYLV